MKIVFYNETLLSGGIEKCIELLCNYLSKENEIEIVYEDDKKLDNRIVEVLSKNAYVHKLGEGEVVNADVCIWCRIYLDYEKLLKQIVADRNILWVHSKPYALENCVLGEKSFIDKMDKIVCVSEAVKNETDIDEKTTVIHNFIDDNIVELSKLENPFKGVDEDMLKLAIVARISAGKGFEKVFDLVNDLKKHNTKFCLKIIGKGRNKEEEIKAAFRGIDEVEFVGYRDNPYPYEKNADYTLVLSPYESWGNVITESKILGTPCVVENFSSAKEQIEDGVNGIIISDECTDFEDIIRKMINEKDELKERLKGFEYKNETEKWNQVLGIQKDNAIKEDK